ncbi:hypothetical protein [Lysobacter changpingensis]|uniref:hypothetical protein n=1 Tax=Lysobacter changpingensis TaxID=2792784 RepID=UPI001A8F24C0|nr:hypothetical protein [Lysobacter changpingensis]
MYEFVSKVRRFAAWAIDEGLLTPAHVSPRDIERYLRELIESSTARRSIKPSAAYIEGVAKHICITLALQPNGCSMIEPQVKRLVSSLAIDRSGRRIGRTPPEPLILELLHEAIRWTGAPADDLIRLRDKYRHGVMSVKHLGHTARRAYGRKELVGEKFSIDEVTGRPWTDVDPTNAPEVARLLRVLQGACIYIIAFACAPRTSEIRAIQSSSLVSREEEDGVTYSYIVGRLAKSGRAHEWVACEPVVKAIRVLERISAPLAEISGRKAVLQGGLGSMLWSARWTADRIQLVTASAVSNKLTLFTEHVSRENQKQLSKSITARHGRRAFARFVTMRNKAALGDLAHHFGHMSRAVTDRYYGSGDGEYARLISDFSHDDAMAVLNEIAHGTSVYTNLGSTVEAQLRGKCSLITSRSRKSLEIRRMLGAGANLAPCDWGVCMYKQDTSACKGSSLGPSDARRSPDVCVDCLNFVVPPSWLPWWEHRVEDLKRFSRLRGMSEQQRLVVESRLAKALQVVARAGGGTDDGSTNGN